LTGQAFLFARLPAGKLADAIWSDLSESFGSVVRDGATLPALRG
jgi:hypothetical protein